MVKLRILLILTIAAALATGCATTGGSKVPVIPTGNQTPAAGQRPDESGLPPRMEVPMSNQGEAFTLEGWEAWKAENLGGASAPAAVVASNTTGNIPNLGPVPAAASVIIEADRDGAQRWRDHNRQNNPGKLSPIRIIFTGEGADVRGRIEKTASILKALDYNKVSIEGVSSNAKAAETYANITSDWLKALLSREVTISSITHKRGNEEKVLIQVQE